jgi:hypothetical protein
MRGAVPETMANDALDRILEISPTSPKIGSHGASYLVVQTHRSKELPKLVNSSRVQYQR